MCSDYSLTLRSRKRDISLDLRRNGPVNCWKLDVALLELNHHYIRIDGGHPCSCPGSNFVIDVYISDCYEVECEYFNDLLGIVIY